MKIDENRYKIGLLVLLSILAGCAIAIALEVQSVNSRLYDLFHYDADADMCFEEARLVQSYCHVERDEDGKYNWYYKPYEGAIQSTVDTSSVEIQYE